MSTVIETGIESGKIRPEIRQLEQKIIDWRRHLHQYPELGFLEILTGQFVEQKLREIGLEPQTGIAKTGLSVLIEGDLPGPTIALRADMDALPIQEENDVIYRSLHHGRMHACGHDGHTAIALGTAYYLVANRNRLSGKVKIIFQPAEEGPGGAKPMIEQGVLKEPDVDVILGLHLSNNLPLGVVGVRSGPILGAADIFHIKIQGKGGHGALPHQTVDSVVVGAQIVNALQTIVSRNIDPIESAVVTIGSFQAGSAPNVIADEAKISGTVRYFNPKYQNYFDKRIAAIVSGICQGQGASYELDYKKYYPPVINDPEITKIVSEIALDVVENEHSVVSQCQILWGEDMSFFLQEVQGCFFLLGSANQPRGLDYPHHHPRFDFDEASLSIGVEMFVRFIERYTGKTFY